MAPKKAKIPSKPSAQTLRIRDDKSKSDQFKLAEVQLSSTVSNTLTAQSFASKLMGEVDLTEAVEVMKEKNQKIISGDLSDLESTLATQVVSLNAIFVTLARRSTTSGHLKQMEANLRLALKAQAQCARTIEILAEIKNPPIVYAKQANIATGHQQINNNQSLPHMEKTINSSNELLYEADNAALDIRGAVETGRVNQGLATMEAINGGKNTKRQS